MCFCIFERSLFDNVVLNYEMSARKKYNSRNTTKSHNNKSSENNRCSYLKSLAGKAEKISRKYKIDNAKKTSTFHTVSGSSEFTINLKKQVSQITKTKFTKNKCTANNLVCSSNPISTSPKQHSTTLTSPHNSDIVLISDEDTLPNQSFGKRKLQLYNTFTTKVNNFIQQNTKRRLTVDDIITILSSDEETKVLNIGQKNQIEIITLSSDEESTPDTQTLLTDSSNIDRQNQSEGCKPIINEKGGVLDFRISDFEACSSRSSMMDQVQLQRSFSDTVIQNSTCLNANVNLFSNLYQPICHIPPAQFVHHKKNKINYNQNRTLSMGDLNAATNNYIDNVQQELDRMKNFRNWENTELGNSINKSNKIGPEIGFIFTLMSYNVLAQVLLTEHPYLYRKHDPRALFWQHRQWALMREIQEHDADILCLQEVEKTHLDSFYSQFHNLGYRGIFKQRTGIRIDGCALYYKHEKFDLLEYITVEYNQPYIDVLDRDNVAIVARFSVKDNPEQQFVVATTHLLYNPKRQDVRMAQTQILFAEVDRIAFQHLDKDGKPVYLPIIITGDFNLEPYTPVYKLIVNGKFKYEGLAPRTLQSPETSRYGNRTSKVLVPKHLRITDNCQHADLVIRRNGGMEKLNRNEELNLIKLQHSERTTEALSASKLAHNVTSEKPVFSSGTLTHSLNLRSVYNHHKPDGQTEATTNQGEWITVDYMFYSLHSYAETRRNVEGKLQLLARYAIPSKSECKKFPYLPNLVLGSDHLALSATFLLKSD